VLAELDLPGLVLTGLFMEVLLAEFHLGFGLYELILAAFYWEGQSGLLVLGELDLSRLFPLSLPCFEKLRLCPLFGSFC
jgi:hypothetical protein